MSGIGKGRRVVGSAVNDVWVRRMRDTVSNGAWSGVSELSQGRHLSLAMALAGGWLGTMLYML